MKPVVLDMYHGDKVASFSMAKESGILGVIHKASQGDHDPLYTIRRRQATAAGLLWGAYHFNTGESAQVQVDRFFAAANPDANTRMVLDFEGSVMALATAVEFLEIADKALGRRLTLYSGDRIKQTIVHAGSDVRAFLKLHPFWLCEYGPTPKMRDAVGNPLPWGKWDLWQYAADGVPHTNHIPGIPVPGIDVNCYEGAEEHLVAGWAGPKV